MLAFDMLCDGNMYGNVFCCLISQKGSMEKHINCHCCVAMFQLVFVAEIPALALSSYTLHGQAEGEKRQTNFANIHIYNSAHTGLTLESE